VVERTITLFDRELPMTMSIAGIGTAVPPHRIAQADAAEIAAKYACETPAQERLFKGMYRRAGVETRHSVVLEASEGDLGARQSFYTHANPTTRDRMLKYEVHSGALAVAAGRAALRDAGVAPEQVTHVITASCSGFYAPGFDITLIKQLGLAARVARTHVGFMGCHGLLNGLRVARAFLAADPRACVLLCAVEMCSLHHQYGWDSDLIVANALFADGAAALVGMTEQTSSASVYRVVATGSTLVDDCEDAMTWRIADHGFQMTLSPRVPELITGIIRPYLDGWLAEQGIKFADVGSWAVHPGGPRILSAFGEATGLDRAMLEPSHSVLAKYGNMSSPTVLFILDQLRRRGAPRPCVALAFGPGLSVESVLLE
jgi:predicted naringenin-chalcone synthase